MSDLNNCKVGSHVLRFHPFQSIPSFASFAVDLTIED